MMNTPPTPTPDAQDVLTLLVTLAELDQAIAAAEHAAAAMRRVQAQLAVRLALAEQRA